ncbi:putative homing endonuclease [Sinorhizobium phage phiM12]|uniref:Putative homing endonuclease n=1 Tax=Sinorhizobium phage phiM12 TaxID=1357423 RepID=S5MBW4_9CAUD|nr:putative homing endonuclease [Sinorhizobium phage phiM12]AGR48118.1 putative homing endonuclease [Sinorhizobium phage phiM12]
MSEKYGFVYIWYDRKKKLYYIGSHWGTEDDGYICSSNRMRKAYRRRPDDFKRRILSRIYTDRLSLLDEEQRWFDMVKRKDRYYNLNFDVKYAWWADPDQKLTVGEKISKALGNPETKQKLSDAAKRQKRKPLSDETKAKLSKVRKGRKSPMKGKRHSEDTKEKMSVAQTGRKFGPMSEEQKAKISDSKKGKPGTPLSQERKDQLSESKRKTYQFLSPDDVLVSIENLREFCRENDLCRAAMCKIANDNYYSKSYKGWRHKDYKG